jgi:hypothetical protein
MQQKRTSPQLAHRIGNRRTQDLARVPQARDAQSGSDNRLELESWVNEMNLLDSKQSLRSERPQFRVLGSQLLAQAFPEHDPGFRFAVALIRLSQTWAPIKHEGKALQCSKGSHVAAVMAA